MKIAKIFFNEKVPIGPFKVKFKISFSYANTQLNARCFKTDLFETPKSKDNKLASIYIYGA